MKNSRLKNSRSVLLALILLVGLQGCNLISPQKQRGGSTISSAGYRISEGDVAIFPEDGTFAKTQAMEAYGKGNYSQSQDFFKQSLQQRPNDPEALIYKNNTIAALSNIPPIKIAVSISGTADASGSREVLRGAAQAQQEVNLAGGLNGHLLSITIGTDNNDAQIAPQVATSFVERSEILGVVGHSASGVSLAAADTYTEAKLVAISPVSSAVQLSNKSPYLFRTVPSDQVAAQALIQHMFQGFKRQKAVVYFNSESSYSKSLSGELKTAITQQGGQTVAEYDLALPGVDFNATLVEAQQKGADVIAVPWHIRATTSENFANRSRKLWGGDVNWRTATAYDATQALIVALRQSATSEKPTRESVQKALKDSSFTASGASRPILFQGSGDRDVPVQLVQITKGKRSGFGYDFQPIEVIEPNSSKATSQ